MALNKLTLDELIRDTVSRHPKNIAITWKHPAHSNVEISELELKLARSRRELKLLKKQAQALPLYRGFLIRYRSHRVEAGVQRLNDKIEAKKWLGLTYETLFEYLVSFAKGLRLLGVSKGDRVAILGDNSPQWLIAALGINWLGGITVPLPPQILQKKPKALIETNQPLLEHNQPKAIVIDKQYYDMITQEEPEFFDKISSLERIVIIEPGPMELRSLDKLQVAEVNEKPNARVWWMNEVLHSGKLDTSELKPENEEEDIATIVYTSGTTGGSVGVMHTHRAIFSNVIFTKHTFPVGEKSRMLSTAPFAHVLGLLLCGYTVFHAGARYVIYTSLKNIAQDVKASKATHLVSFPQLYSRMFNRIYSNVESSGLKRLML
ncbi:hypothetical protein DRJ48_04535, partial [Candidatus Woesearchaeota archaeon]